MNKIKNKYLFNEVIIYCVFIIRKINPRRVARDLKVTPVNFFRILEGTKPISPAMLEKISELLKIPQEVLVIKEKDRVVFRNGAVNFKREINESVSLIRLSNELNVLGDALVESNPWRYPKLINLQAK